MNGHACVPKRHFGVQAWVNRSSRLRTAIDLTHATQVSILKFSATLRIIARD
jgi:hypothetical protein